MQTHNWAIIQEVSQQSGVNAAAREKERFREAGSALGAQVIEVAANWARNSEAEEALERMPKADHPIPTILSGFIHPAEEYSELFEAAARRNFFLLNDPDQYQRSHSMREALPRLDELTPRTVFIDTIDDLRGAIETIGFPAFVKGDVQSRKDRGWSACVANNESELEEIARGLLDSYAWSEGYVVIRELIPLRHAQTQPDGFPIGREFRVILFKDKVVALGYYWPGEDPLSRLTASEEQEVRKLAQQASLRMEVPFLVVDIGQTDAGDWIAIETGDPQTAGFGEIDITKMFEGIIKVGW